jgi:predicted RNA methylase
MIEDQPVSLRIVLQAISLEISRLADIIEPIEIALESSLARDDAVRGFRQIFQNLDLHAQSVESLVRMIQALAAKIPNDVQIVPASAIAEIHLDRIRARMKSSFQSSVKFSDTSDLHSESIRTDSPSPFEIVSNIELF